MSARRQWLLAAMAVLLPALLGGWCGYWLAAASKPPLEEARPLQRQGDGSVIAARAPSADPGPPPHRLPPGAREERRVAVTVQPPRVTPVPDASGVPWCDCPPVTVDLSLVQAGDGRRVVASSRDGVVLDALDIPIEPLPIAPTLAWAAGLSYGARGEVGAWVERDLSRLRLGVDVEQDRQDQWTARLRLGWRF
ncbi:hypothetical protein [Chitiniphilus shinanonensis]|uniref:hypothetical protein n=1 Tax=Chitiniphilus shinanonensis TaxID=553088 RepID=UPI00305349E5